MIVAPPTLPIAPAQDSSTQPVRGAGTAVERLGATFSGLLAEVNRLQVAADSKMKEFATSQEKDVHGTMIALQQADLSLRLFLQVRAKLTAAYQELMRMQL